MTAVDLLTLTDLDVALAPAVEHIVDKALDVIWIVKNGWKGFSAAEK